MYKRTICIKRQKSHQSEVALIKKKRKQQFWKWYEKHFICFENIAGLMIAVTLVTRQESRQDSYRKWILQFNCKSNIRNVSSERLAQIHARFHSDYTAVSRWTVQGFRFPFEFMLRFTNAHISFWNHSVGPPTHMWMQLTPYSRLWNLLGKFSELWKQQQQCKVERLIFVLLISVKIRRNITDILFTDQQINSWGIADHQTSHDEGQPEPHKRCVLHRHVFSAHIFPVAHKCHICAGQLLRPLSREDSQLALILLGVR